MALPNPVERKLIAELMEPTDVGCKPHLKNNHVYYCSSPKMQENRPKDLREEEWGKCSFYRLRDLCTKDPEKCCFY